MLEQVAAANKTTPSDMVRTLIREAYQKPQGEMMKATINSTGQVITGKNLQDIRGQMNRMLSGRGPRGLTATTETGTEIHVELYGEQDYVRTADGRQLRK